MIGVTIFCQFDFAKCFFFCRTACQVWLLWETADESIGFQGIIWAKQKREILCDQDDYQADKHQSKSKQHMHIRADYNFILSEKSTNHLSQNK